MLRFWQKLAIFFLLTSSVSAWPPPAPSPLSRLAVTVTDENGVAIAAAHVSLQLTPQSAALRCDTDFSGHCQFPAISVGDYRLRVEKPGFYALVLPAVHVGITTDVEVRLSPQREVREEMNVVELPPAIDPTQTASQEQLTGLNIIDIPYPDTRDYRNALNFIPGVVQDASGQPHVAGAETYQTLTLLDGFNVTQPANGLLLVRVSTDAFRLVQVESSRIPAEYGKATAGVLSMNTLTGDDHYRFTITDFIPSVQDKNGLTFDKVDPRINFSGPLRKGKAWFFNALEGEYDNVVITELPSNADSDHVWRVSELAKVQTNLTSRNILTTSFLYNHLHDEYLGLSVLAPQQASPVDAEAAYVANIKDQHYFHSGKLLETGFGFVQNDLNEYPHGNLPYFITPETSGGSYYLTQRTQARRWQALANLYLPSRQWHGRHEFRLGIDLDRVAYDAAFQRQPIAFLREGQSPPPNGNCLAVIPSPCSRYSTFSGGGESLTHNVQTSGYVQDRWSPANRLTVESGLRYDWDEILRQSLFSPRLSAAYALDSEAKTKLSAGVGLVYDETSIRLIARPLAGERQDVFFDANGNPLGAPVVTTFSANPSSLSAPRSLNWSAAIERRLPAAVYLKAEFIERLGSNGLVYNTVNEATGGNFQLQSTRQDHYDAIQLALRKHFRGPYMVFGSYTRSKTRSNQVLDFNVDNPVLSPQAAGPYPWDTPNRFISWGLLPFFKLPLIKKLDLAYSAEWRDGFDFSVVNDQSQLVGARGSQRFPAYFTLNVQMEKRFHAFGHYLAIRAGFDNITGHRNPTVVNNDIDSPQFLTFSNFTGRAFTTRIRLLGTK
ncbi:MAG: TonB-dependent receptor [Candidatus Korobacteraceae bacterium]